MQAAEPPHEDPVAAGFGPVLRRLRTEAGMGRKELCEGVGGLSPSHLSKIEQGVRFPSPALMSKLADALGTDAKTLLRLAESEGIALLQGATSEQTTVPQEGRASYTKGAPTGDRRPRKPTLHLSSHPSDGQPPAWEAMPVLPGYSPDDEAARQLFRWAQRVAARDPSQEVLDVLERLLSVLSSAGLDSHRVAQAVDLALHMVRAVGDEGGTAELERLLAYAVAISRTPDPVAEHVWTMPPNEARYLFRNALGLDDSGVWVDPVASARKLGLDSDDPRVTRWDDGRVLVDLSRLTDDVALGPRDPRRHRVRAAVVRAMPGDTDVPVDRYEATRLVLRWEPTVTIEVDWAPAGTAEGAFPPDVQAIHVVTAHNPHPHILPPEENARRNAELRAAITAAGLRWCDARGESVNPHEPWSEDSFALTDAGREAAVALAQRFGQVGIFEWTNAYRALVRCDRPSEGPDEVVHLHGWRAGWL